MQQPSIVGFFDILGTRDSVMADRFDDSVAFDFVNAVGIAARSNPTVRFAVFSDSVIVSADVSEIKPLLRAINLMYGNWFSDLIYVRGAVACGDIHWVDDPATDEFFKNFPNFTYARVYGKGLVIAYELEQKSGPGAICFLTEQVAELFRKEEPGSVLESHSPLLCWATQREARVCQGYAKSHLDRAKKDTQTWRQAMAIKHYWDLVVSQAKFLPDSYSL